jgi:gamma-glutamylcyclotransferase (GGCT)/AIG2-like uncharacterized protein YtfP
MVMRAADTEGRPHDLWWRSPELHGELEAILGLINDARSQAGVDEERAARKLFDALNRGWNAFRRFAPETADSDWQALKAFVLSLLSGSQAIDLAVSGELAGLAAIEPPILDHSTLLQRGVLGSIDDIEADVRRRAQAKHLRLRRALEDRETTLDYDELERVLVRVADLLYVIRSNLMHGEKFAGSDPRRRARDRIIAGAAGRVVDLFFDLVFDRPSTRLAVYGSLRPGGSNSSALDDIAGSWHEGLVYGTVEDVRGVPVLSWGHGGEPVDVLILSADDLSDHFGRLDEFEGSRYERILVPVERPDGQAVVANIYARRASGL